MSEYQAFFPVYYRIFSHHQTVIFFKKRNMDVICNQLVSIRIDHIESATRISDKNTFQVMRFVVIIDSNYKLYF